MCSEASGPVTCLATNRTPSIYGLVCMAGACAQQDATYNRPGETLFLSYEGDAAHCWILDGHKQGDHQPGPGMRSTVTALEYDPHWNCFISAGYDGHVIGWDPTGLQRLYTFAPSNRPIINSLAFGRSRSESLLAYGTSSGQLGVIRYDLTDRSLPQLRASTRQLASQRKGRNWANSVDCLAFSPTQPDVLLAAVGFDEERRGGTLWRTTEELKTPVLLYTHSRGIPCLDVRPTGTDLVAVGSAGVIDDSTGTGSFVLVDGRTVSRSPVATVFTGQRDMDSIKFRYNNFAFARGGTGRAALNHR